MSLRKWEPNSPFDHKALADNFQRVDPPAQPKTAAFNKEAEHSRDMESIYQELQAMLYLLRSGAPIENELEDLSNRVYGMLR